MVQTPETKRLFSRNDHAIARDLLEEAYLQGPDSMLARHNIFRKDKRAKLRMKAWMEEHVYPEPLYQSEVKYRRLPSSHGNWEELVTMLVSDDIMRLQHMEACGIDPDNPSTHSMASHAAAILTGAVLNRFPVYCLTEDLCLELANTRAPEVTEEMAGIAPRLTLVLPKERGESSRTKEDVLGGRVDRREGKWVAAVAGLNTKFRGISFFCYNEEAIQTRSQWEQDQWRIYAGALAILAYKPELIDAPPASLPPIPRGTGFKACRARPAPLAPAWIRLPEGQPARPRRRASCGHGVSPQMHWRRGHWHTVTHGEKRQQRSLRWYRPTLGGAGS